MFGRSLGWGCRMAVANSNSGSGVLVFHHNEICRVLTLSETTLCSLAGELFAKGIIDDVTKSEVMSKGGYKGADTLMDLIMLKVDSTPEILPTVFEAMRGLETLEDIVKKMEKWEREDKDVQGKYCSIYNVSCLFLLYQMILMYYDH